MPVPKDLIAKHPELDRWCILAGYRGSISHGTYSSDKDSIDDKDAIFICVPPLDYYFGLKHYGRRGTKEIKRDEWDIVVYELRKFARLLANSNPNVLSLLWLPERHYLKKTQTGEILIANRNLFATKKAYKSFSGYAYSQLIRMQRAEHYGYMGKKRKELVERFGYDTKNAVHLVRLLRMGIEFLTDGELYVEREDASQLLAIKRGEYTLEQIKAIADSLFGTMQYAYINSSLPKAPDREKINKLCLDILHKIFIENPYRANYE